MHSQKNQLLAELKEAKWYEKQLQEQLDNEKRKYNVLLQTHEEFLPPFKIGEVQGEMQKLQDKITKAKDALRNAKVLSLLWDKQVRDMSVYTYIRTYIRVV